MKKIAIMPCNGVGRIVSTITREAGYRIHHLRPDATILISSPDLACDNPEALSIAKKYPLIVIDGCKPRCGSNIVKAKGIKPILEIYAPLVCADKKIPLSGETRVKLGLNGAWLAEAITEIAVQAIDDLLSNKIPTIQKNLPFKVYMDDEEILSRL
ncbi:MAG: putative zinc-binding protein [Candidatus Omnitrophota bacterium]|nr:putative zinc-binding protein [Candidatus Omnitrophota bacterium]